MLAFMCIYPVCNIFGQINLCRTSVIKSKGPGTNFHAESSEHIFIIYTTIFHHVLKYLAKPISIHKILLF